MEDVVISESVKAKARDFIDNEKQFQLGFLPTEQLQDWSKAEDPPPVQVALGQLRNGGVG